MSDLPLFFVDKTPVYCKKTLGSTNESIKTYPDQEIVLVSEYQSKGKGTHNRVWESEKGGLYYSYMARKISLNSDFYLTLTQKMGVALQQVILALAGLKAQVKEPNDLLIDGKKCAGILVEASQKANRGIQEYLIIGIGLNLNQVSFSESLRSQATSLQIESTKEYNKDIFIKYITRMIKDVLSSYQRRNNSG